MKKKAIFTIVACSVAFLILTCVLVVGLSMNDSGSNALLQEYKYTLDPVEAEVTGLDVEWINGAVEVKAGSGNVVRVTENASERLKDSDRLEMSVSGGTLKIKWKDELISFAIFQNRRKDLTVEVPRALAESMEKLKCSNTSGTITVSGFAAEEMEFSSTSGDLELSGLSGTEAGISTVSGRITLEGMKLSQKLDVSSTSGDLKLSEVRAGEAELSTTSGSISYTGSADEFAADTVSASVRAELDNCPGKSSMNSVSGTLTLEIPENSGFAADYDSISGSFKSDFAVTTSGGKKSGRAEYGSGKADFDFSTTSGDMQVLKK